MKINLFKDRKSTRLNSSHSQQSRMPSSAWKKKNKKKKATQKYEYKRKWKKTGTKGTTVILNREKDITRKWHITLW